MLDSYELLHESKDQEAQSYSNMVQNLNAVEMEMTVSGPPGPPGMMVPGPPGPPSGMQDEQASEAKEGAFDVQYGKWTSKRFRGSQVHDMSFSAQNDTVVLAYASSSSKHPSSLIILDTVSENSCCVEETVENDGRIVKCAFNKTGTVLATLSGGTAESPTACFLKLWKWDFSNNSLTGTYIVLPVQ